MFFQHHFQRTSHSFNYIYPLVSPCLKFKTNQNTVHERQRSLAPLFTFVFQIEKKCLALFWIRTCHDNSEALVYFKAVNTPSTVYGISAL